LSNLLLLVVICVALWTTKLPMLAQEHFWSMAHEVRGDYAMLPSLLFLLIVAAGPFSIDTG